MIRTVSTLWLSAVLLVSVSPMAYGQDDAQRGGRRQKEPVEVIHREKQDPNAQQSNGQSRDRNEQPEPPRGRERRERP